MMGIRGAGLNMFMFLSFNSVVVEVHIGGTTGQNNSANIVTHIGGGKYLPLTGYTNLKKQLEIPPVWEA
jgi:hypothetical protein